MGFIKIVFLFVIFNGLVMPLYIRRNAEQAVNRQNGVVSGLRREVSIIYPLWAITRRRMVYRA
jgi:hypothetical protein